ncbi:MAG: hypothetical protein ACRETG_12485 [Steroidobacteraceae bacterium]
MKETSPAPALSQAEESLSSALSPGQESLAPALSQWLQLMLAEITRKREDLERARAEESQRQVERAAPPADRCGSASLYTARADARRRRT